MTFEQMIEYAEQIAVTLANSGFGPSEVLREDCKPGDPIPISCQIDGGDFVLELNVL